MTYDHILFIGFGGPTAPEEVEPFLKQVTKGRKIPEARLKGVAHHYELIGGKSPYNEYTYRLFDKVEGRLRQEGVEVPMFVGMRNWHPFLTDTVKDIKAKGLRKGLGIILAAHRSESSCSRYKENIQNAVRENQAGIQYDFLDPWFDHPDFLEAQADQIRRLINDSKEPNTKDAVVVFTAHSIPTSMKESCHRCDYADEFLKSSQIVAEKLALKNWTHAYQSRSGNPKDPWLEPDVGEVIRELSAKGAKAVLLVPIGFLCDNAEVLYDLDIEAKQIAEEKGILYFRASTVMDHPVFVRMFSDMIKRKVNPISTDSSSS